MINRLFLFALGWIIFAANTATAQNAADLFDSTVDEAADSTDNSQKTKSSNPAFDIKENNAVVHSLRANPPTTPIELARAIRLMTRVQRWDEVARWTDALGQLFIDPETALKISDQVGSQTFVEIERNASNFQEKQLATLRAIQDKALKAIHDPNALLNHVKQLRSDAKAERLSAFRAIRSAGNSGITALINELLTDGAAAPTPTMIEAFSLLGDRATRAWQVAMTTMDNDAKNRLLALVARSPQPAMGCELMAALHDPEVLESTKKDISASLVARGKGVPEPLAVYRFAVQLVENSIGDFQRRRKLDEPAIETVWRWSDDGKSIEEGMGTVSDLVLARAAQAGVAALRLSASANQISTLSVVAVLEYRSQSGTVDESALQPISSLMPKETVDDVDFNCLVWDAAVSQKLVGAQAIAVSSLSRWSGPTLPATVRSRLVSACKNGNAFVRYTAAAAMMQTIDQARNAPTDSTAEMSFEGRSRVDLVAFEMKLLHAKPMALIVGISDSLRTHVRGLAIDFGYQIIEASTVAEVFQELRHCEPVEAIFIVDHLRDADLGELVQRIRSYPSFGSVPIALVANSLSRGEHSVASQDRLIVVGSVPPQADGFGDILRRMEIMRDAPRIDSANRIAWKEVAEEYLSHLKSKPVTSNAQQEFGIDANSREGQEMLLRIVSDSAESARKRDMASQLFVQSVRRFGLMISSESKNAQYDVYNERGEGEPVTRTLMGRVLDAIDAANGVRDWSKVAP